MAQVRTEAAKWRVHECMLDLSREMSFAADCADRSRHPLVFLWGDSTAGSLIPGLLKAQESRDFSIAQFTSSSCAAALNADIPGVPNCRAINDKVLGLARQLQPDIVLLHGTAEKFILGPEPFWRRGLPNEVLRYYLLHHRLIPARTHADIGPQTYDADLRGKLVPKGAEFISAWDVFCNADGCLARVGDQASDITASDIIHLTEKGSIFLIQAIIDRVLKGEAAPAAKISQ